MNFFGIKALFFNELERSNRTQIQSFLSPIISTLLYILVFGSVMSLRVGEINGTPYPIYIIPGLIILNAVGHSIFSASFGIFVPKFTGAIYENLAAPISYWEVIIAYVGAAAFKTLMVCFIVFCVTQLMTPYSLSHPFLMVFFLFFVVATFSLFGLLFGLFAQNFEQLHVIPSLVITPLTFLGGTFFSIASLPSFWQTVSLFNPLVYVIDTFRWTFFGVSQFSPRWGGAFIAIIFMLCFKSVMMIFRRGYGIRP